MRRLESAVGVELLDGTHCLPRFDARAGNNV